MTWTTAATIVTSVLQIGYTAVMARLLPPAAFGLVALAGVVLRFGGFFAQMGMAQAIVQKPELTDEDVRAAFTSSVLLGAVFAGAMVVGAPLARLVFQQHQVVQLAAGNLHPGAFFSIGTLLLRSQGMYGGKGSGSLLCSTAGWKPRTWETQFIQIVAIDGGEIFHVNLLGREGLRGGGLCLGL